MTLQPGLQPCLKKSSVRNPVIVIFSSNSVPSTSQKLMFFVIVNPIRWKIYIRKKHQNSSFFIKINTFINDINILLVPDWADDKGAY